jgi:hypothetical protein
MGGDATRADERWANLGMHPSKPARNSAVRAMGKTVACGSHGSSCPGSHGLGVRSDAVASVAGDRLVARSGFSGWQFRLRLCERCCDGADGVTKAVHWLALHDLYIKDHRPDLDRLAQIPWRIALEPTVTRPSWTMRFVAETSSGSASLRSSRHSRNKASRRLEEVCRLEWDGHDDLQISSFADFLRGIAD